MEGRVLSLLSDFTSDNKRSDDYSECDINCVGVQLCGLSDEPALLPTKTLCRSDWNGYVLVEFLEFCALCHQRALSYNGDTKSEGADF